MSFFALWLMIAGSSAAVASAPPVSVSAPTSVSVSVSTPASVSTSSSAAPAPRAAADAALVFRDATSCAEVVRAGGRDHHSGLRVVSWNVRWFPDGGPGKKPRDGTNLAWLACVLRWLDADVVALQEIKRLPHAIAALDTVVSAMAGKGVTWKVAADDCPDPSRQHLVFLYRSDRVRLTHIKTRGEIDPTVVRSGTPTCPGRLRPALAAYVRGHHVSFHLATVHLDSGKDARDADDRRLAWQRLAPLVAAMQHDAVDDDVIVLGDFNTMGQSGGTSALEEVAEMTAAVRALASPFHVASASLKCTEYYKDHGNVLDHVLVSTAMQEAKEARIAVSGTCAALQCARLDALWLPALEGLSDHCPVTVDIPDVDLDDR